MIHESDSMRQIHAIQERLHEERRGWTDAQLIEEYNRKVQDAAKRLGLKITPLPEQTLKRRAG